MWQVRLARLGLCLCLGLLGLSLRVLGVADPPASALVKERNLEWWENLGQHAGTAPVWVCPSHPQHSWGGTVGGSYVGLHVFTDHSVVWMPGYDQRIPFVMSPRRLWTGLLGSGAIVGSLLVYGICRSRRGSSSRPPRVPG